MKKTRKTPLVQNSEEQATLFTTLYNRYYKLIRNFLGRNKMLPSRIIEDFTQDTFLLVWSHMATIETLTEQARQAYIFMIARNLVRDYYRKSYALLNDSYMPIVDIHMCDGGIETCETRIDAQKELGKALACLSDDRRALLYELYVQGMQATEIASREHENDVTIRNRVRRAKETVRAFYTQQEREVQAS